MGSDRTDKVARLGKAALAVAVFVAIVGGWWGLQYYRHVAEQTRIAASPLPGSIANEHDCTLWFVGSSSIHNWTQLPRDMQPWDARNRGIAGATINQIRSRFDNGSAAKPPQAIIFYAGENDINAGGTGRQAIIDLIAFVREKRRRMGGVPMLVLSMKPSPTRWGDRPEQEAFNRGLLQIARSQGDIAYIDITTPMLIDGRPGPFYIQDGIHMNPAGYVRWAAAVRKELPRALPPSVVRHCDPSLARH